MGDYMVKIAKLLLESKPVIFYTVGSGTFECIRVLKVKYGLLPTAICDRDSKKQGNTYRGLEGLIVVPPESAMVDYPGAYWFIPSLDYRFQIIAYLTENLGIPSDHIINYTPVHKVKSCLFLQKALIYDRTGDLRFCWRTPCPALSSTDGIDGKKFRALRDGLIESIQTGGVVVDPACANCPQICEDYYPEESKAWSVNYFCNSVCNYNCSYCTIGGAPPNDSEYGRRTLGEVITAFKEAKLLDPDYSVVLSTAGEPLLHPRRKEFYQAFDGAEFVVNTNGSIYDPDLFEMMTQKQVLLITSVDAGTRETYRKIKGIDGFSRIRNNLSRYAQATMGIVALKYLFVPGVNDFRADIDGFVELCMDIGAMFVIVSIDYFSISNITEHTKNMVQRLRTALAEKHILYVPYTAWETNEYNKMMRELFE